MDDTLLATVQRLVEEDQDTLAGTELLLTAVFEAAGSLVGRQKRTGHTVASVTATCDAAATFLEQLIRSAMCRIVGRTDLQALSLRSLVQLDGQGMCSVGTAERSAGAQAPVVDARELLTGMLSVIAVHLQGATPTECDEETGDEVGNAACSLHHLQILLLLLPRLMSVLCGALPLLFAQAAHRSTAKGSGHDDVRVKVVLSLLAWFPQILQLIRDACAIATQQDGDVQYVETAAFPGTPSDDAQEGFADEEKKPPVSIVSPELIERTVLGRSGLIDASLLLLSDCVVLLSACCVDISGGKAHITEQSGQRHRQCLRVCHELFLTMGAVRHASVAAGHFREEEESNEMPSSICGIGHLLRGTHSSLHNVVRSLETAAEKKQRASRRNMRSPAADVGTSACSPRIEHFTSPAAWPASMPSVCYDIVRVCARSGLCGGTSYFEHIALSIPAPPSDQHVGGANNNPYRCPDDVEDDPLQALIDVVHRWSVHVGESVVAEQHVQDDLMGGPPRHAKRSIAASPGGIMRRCRDRAFNSDLPLCNDPGAIATEEDERRILRHRMDMCSRVESSLSPLMLFSSSSDDEREVDEASDPQRGVAESLRLPSASLTGSGTVVLAGTAMVLLDLIGGPPACRLPVPPCLVGATSLPCASMARFVEWFGVVPVRLLLRSKSLSTVALGLRLWDSLLSRVPKYSVDVPGEIRLTCISKSTEGDGAPKTDRASDCHLDDAVALVSMVDVECDDLHVGALRNDDHAPPASTTLLGGHLSNSKKGRRDTQHGNAFRTTGFAQHYYLLQDMLSIVVMNPCSSHRLAARAVALHRHLPWYVAPVRSKMLCQMIYTAPFGSVATALLQKLKEEIVEGYNAVWRQLQEQQTQRLSYQGGAAAAGLPHVDLGVSRWFINLSVLQYLLGSLRQWTTQCRLTRARAPSTEGMPPDVAGIVSTAAVPNAHGGSQSFVECVATGLNLVHTIMQWEHRIVDNVFAPPSQATGSVRRAVVLDLTRCASSSTWKAKGSSDPGASAKRLSSSSEFFFLLDLHVLRVWHSACNEAPLAGVSPIDAFSILEMVTRIRQGMHNAPV